MAKITIESDEPCLVLVLPLPRRVEPPRAPRRVIETTGEELPPSQPSIRSARVVQFPVRRVAGSRGFALARVLTLLAVFAVLLLLLSLTGCGGAAESAEPTSCPHRTTQVTDAAGNVTTVDNTPEQDQQVCDYLAYLQAHVHDGTVDCDARAGVSGGQCGEAGAAGQP